MQSGNQGIQQSWVQITIQEEYTEQKTWALQEEKNI